jgi:polar amino acid transport system substrate-binding protein
MLKPLITTLVLFSLIAATTNYRLHAQENSALLNKSQQSSDIFNSEERDFINRKQVITVCNVMQQASKDASLNIVKLIADKSGLIFEATPLIPWAKALQEINAGNCDVLPWATSTEARSKTMNFTRPYVRIKRVVITKQQEYYFRDLDEVKDKVFVMLRANYAITQIRNKYPDMKFISVDTIQEELDYISADKAFGTIVSLYSAANLFNNQQQRDLKVSGVLPSIYDDIASLATLKEEKVLHSILEKSLLATDPRFINEFMTDGAVVSFNPSVDYKKYWYVGISVVFVVLMLIWWNRSLKIINGKLKESQRKLELLSITDPLTKTFNRLKMDEVFSQEIKTGKRYHSPLSVIMLDIDHFKKINDEFGHIVGDSVLKKIAQVIKSSLRTNDFLGRWGGEEFLIICPSTNIDKAKMVAEKLRAALVNTPFTPLKKVTASFGVAEWEVEESQDSLISRADSALYRSKNDGRNRVRD